MCEQLRGLFTDMTYAQRMNKPRERRLPTRFNRREKLAHGQRSPTVAFCKVELSTSAAPGQGKDIGWRPDKAGVQEALHLLAPQSGDVKSGARREESEAFQSLSVAREVSGAAPNGFFLSLAKVFAQRGGSANGTRRRKAERGGASWTISVEDFEDLRNDVARPAHERLVSGPYVLAGDFVLVVEAGAPDDNAPDVDGLEDGDRRDRAGSSDLKFDLEDLRLGFFSGEFVGDGPARRPPDEPKALLIGEAIDLVDHPVDVKTDSAAFSFDLAIEIEGFLKRVHDFSQRIDGQPPGVEKLKQGAMALDMRLAVAGDGVGKVAQSPVGEQTRIEQSHGTGRSISWVCESALFFGILLPVERIKVVPRHEDLAAHFDLFWRASLKF